MPFALCSPQPEMPPKLPTEGETWGKLQRPLKYSRLLLFLEQWFSIRGNSAHLGDIREYLDAFLGVTSEGVGDTTCI